MANPGSVSNFSAWSTNDSADIHVEKLLDSAAFSSGHPDDTVVLAGPPRLNSLADYNSLAVVGMLQNISINQSKPFQPMMSLGSARTFYMAGKAQGSAQIGRLFLNTDSLMKKLYENYTTSPTANGKIAPSAISSTNAPGAADSAKLFINLDSNYFLLPFGLGVVFRDKSKKAIGGLYMELCVIPNYTISVQAGQSMVMEGVSILFDRVVGMNVSEAFTDPIIDKAINGDGKTP